VYEQGLQKEIGLVQLTTTNFHRACKRWKTTTLRN
jgi:hypothetical protein